MYLKLSITDSRGYISTIDDNEKSLVCKPVSADEISKMAQEYTMNDNYIVGMEDNQDGSIHWIVEDKSNPRKLIEAQNMAVQQTAKKIDDSKQSLEFSRYKQDCRKRSMDLAMSNSGIGNPTPPDIMKVAEDYYQWLISIPDSN